MPCRSIAEAPYTPWDIIRHTPRQRLSQQGWLAFHIFSAVTGGILGTILMLCAMIMVGPRGTSIVLYGLFLSGWSFDEVCMGLAGGAICGTVTGVALVSHFRRELRLEQRTAKALT